MNGPSNMEPENYSWNIYNLFISIIYEVLLWWNAFDTKLYRIQKAEKWEFSARFRSPCISIGVPAKTSRYEICHQLYDRTTCRVLHYKVWNKKNETTSMLPISWSIVCSQKSDKIRSKWNVFSFSLRYSTLLWVKYDQRYD